MLNTFKMQRGEILLAFDELQTGFFSSNPEDRKLLLKLRTAMEKVTATLNVSGEDDYSLPDSYIRLGNVNLALGEYPVALQKYRRALAIIENFHPPKSDDD